MPIIKVDSSVVRTLVIPDPLHGSDLLVRTRFVRVYGPIPCFQPQESGMPYLTVKGNEWLYGPFLLAIVVWRKLRGASAPMYNSCVEFSSLDAYSAYVSLSNVDISTPVSRI